MAWRQWTRDDDKRLEGALVRFPENTPFRFETIACDLQLPLEEVMYYCEALVHDIDLIESGRVAVPNYPDYSVGFSPSQSSKHDETERKRGVPWSEEEHGNFLKGLAEFGKGDWKSIARRHVKSRSATQVASHAQKYFLRQNLESKAKKRSSIHDITSVDAKSESVLGPDLDSMMDQPHFGDLDSMMDQPHFGDLDSMMDQSHFGDLDSMLDQPHFVDLDSMMGQPHFGDLDSMLGQPHFGDQQMPPEDFHSHGYFSGS